MTSLKECIKILGGEVDDEEDSNNIEEEKASIDKEEPLSAEKETDLLFDVSNF